MARRSVLLAFVCLIYHASGLASPSPLNGYHFGATASARKVSASNLRPKQTKSYVPDGLTEEQYQRIKNDELATQKSMKFGMWGPRFSQVDGDPDSNWFNLPSLWTGGFNASQQNAGSVKDGGEATTGVVGLLVKYLRQYALAYLMLLASTELLARSLSAKKALSSKWVIVRVFLPLVALTPMRVFAAFAGQRRLAWLNKNGTTKLASFVAMLMTLLACVLR